MRTSDSISAYCSSCVRKAFLSSITASAITRREILAAAAAPAAAGSAKDADTREHLPAGQIVDAQETFFPTDVRFPPRLAY
jgi:hypothetical protein